VRTRALRYFALAFGLAGLAALYVRSPAQGLHWSEPAIGLVLLVAVFTGDLLFVERTIRTIVKDPAREEALTFQQRAGSRLERIVAEHRGNAVG
jgi:hypothetical protein